MPDYEDPSEVPWREEQFTKVVIEEGISSVGICAFRKNDKICVVELPSSVTRIDPYAFWDCFNLTSIIIPENVIYIAENTFGDCRNLTIVCKKGSFAEKYALEEGINYLIQ